MAQDAKKLKTVVTGILEIDAMNATFTQNERLFKTLQTAIDYSFDGFWIIDLQGNFLQVNDALSRMSGYSKTELLNMSLGELESTWNLDEKKIDIEKIMTQNYDHVEISYCHKEKYQVNVHMRAYFLPEQQAIYGFFHCISEFCEIYNCTPEAVMIIDEGHFIHCNAPTLKLFGISAYQEFCSSSPSTLSPPKQPCGTSSAILVAKRIAVALEKGFIRFEWVHKRADTGEPFFAEVFLRSIVLNHKLVLHATVHDISERHERENMIRLEKESVESSLRELKSMQSDLVQSEKMAALGSLVAGVAHEINTPLGIILTSTTHLNSKTNKVAALYEQGELEEIELTNYFKSTTELTRLITFNSERAAALIGSFKQVAVDETSSEKRTFLLKHYIQDILSSLNPTLKKTALRVDLTCPDDLEISCCAGAIAQIITNFVMNSLQHAYEPEQAGVLSIRITQFSRNNAVRLVYRDDGKGIPKDLQQKVFEPFVTTRRNNGGTGLGLHIVYNLVYQTLKGHLKMFSSPKGTVFVVTFPKCSPVCSS